MKTTWTILKTTAIAAAILCTLSVSGAWAGDPLSTDTFPPAYPSGGAYNDYINGFDIPIDLGPISIEIPIPGLDDLGLIPDGTTNRCDTNGEAVQQFVLAGVNAGDVLGNGICNAITPEPVESVCWAALTVIQEVFVLAETNAMQCEFQDALVDGAEIEAAFENTAIIHSDLGLHDDRLITHDEEVQAKLDELIGKVDLVLARQLETIRLIHTPQGRRSTDVPACDGEPCTWNP
jgi:hypothetical protein